MAKQTEHILEEEECEFGGDITNDCSGCIYSNEYHFDPETGLCIKRDVKRQ